MTRRLWPALLALFVAPVLLAPGPGVRAQEAAPVLLAPPLRAQEAEPARLDASVLADPAWQGTDPTTPLAVMVVLAGPTAWDQHRQAGYKVGDTTLAAQASLDGAYERLAELQAPARAAILATGAELVATYDTAMNGFLVRGTPAQITAITAAPGVERVYRAPLYYPDLQRAVPMIGADEVAQALGFTGRGVHIGIIDTGIDYTHKNLGGNGSVEDFEAILKDPAKPAHDHFPNDKVIGGYDFAGRYYTGDNAPQPDENPIDEAGHGTHVSGIAAGNRGNEAQVYHGVAPDAKLVALKVFGYQGGTNVSTSAIEWAIEANLGRPVPGVAARVDVLNMSLGSAFAAGIEDALGTISRATEAGILVVVSAGNSGDVGFITGSPCVAPQALCVASTVAAGERGDQVEVTENGASRLLEALEASGELAVSVLETGKVQAPLVWLGRACENDPVEGDMTGKVVLMERGGCSFVEKLATAAGAGAVGALVHNDQAGIITMGADAGDVRSPIPAFMIGQQDGQRLHQSLDNEVAVEARLDPALKNTLAKDYLADTISSFSSRGPGRNGEFKPNISAPGSRVFAPRIGSGDAGIALDGTSMAAPMVAGAAAVVMDRLRSQGLAPVDEPLDGRSGLGATDVAAFLVNYVSPQVWQDDNRTGPLMPLARSGAGRTDLSRAARGRLLLKSGGLAAINYGIQAFDDTFSREESVTVRNLADAQRRFSLEVVFRDPTKSDSGVVYTPLVAGNPAKRINLSPNSAVTLKLQLAAAANQLRRYPIYGGQSSMNGDGRMHEAEYDAYLVVTEIDGSNQPVPGGDVARLPIYLLPRGTSVIEASPAPLKVDPATKRGPVVLTNRGGQPGRAELFAYWAEDAVEDTVGSPINIDHLGLRIGRDGNNQRTVEFAVHTVGQHLAPLEARFDVFIENDSDAGMDYAIYNYDLGAATGRGVDGQQVVIVVNLETNSGTLRYFANTDLQNRTVILPVAATDIGYGANEPVDFQAVVVARPVLDDLGIDFVPDGGVDDEGNFTSDRLSFDEGQLPFSLDRWSVEVAEGGLTASQVTWRGGGTAGALDRVLALYPQNLQRRNDLQILAIEEGVVPTVPASPTPRVTNTPTVPPTATLTPVASNTPAGPPTVTPTRRPVIPTPGDDWGRIYLPLTRND